MHLCVQKRRAVQKRRVDKDKDEEFIDLEPKQIVKFNFCAFYSRN